VVASSIAGALDSARLGHRGPFIVVETVVTLSRARMEQQSALIVSRDPVAAALLGALAELQRLEPIFYRDAEGPTVLALLEQARPAVAIVDVAHDSGASPQFFRRAAGLNARVVIFGDDETGALTRRCAAEYGVDAVVLPADVRSLTEILRGASQQP
jgi:DNA-binding NarL/FixJ family response regulator